MILIEIANKKFLTEECVPRLAENLKKLGADATFGPVFQNIYNNKIAEDQKNRVTEFLK